MRFIAEVVQFFGQKAILLSLGVLALFYTGHYLVGRDEAKTVMDSLVIGGAVVIFLSWFRATVLVIKERVRTPGATIVVSMWLVWTILLLYFIYVFLFGVMGRPEDLRNTPIAGTFSTLFFIAAAFAILTPLNMPQDMPRPRLAGWTISVAIGSMVAGGLMVAAFTHLLELPGSS